MVIKTQKRTILIIELLIFFSNLIYEKYSSRDFMRYDNNFCSNFTWSQWCNDACERRFLSTRKGNPYRAERPYSSLIFSNHTPYSRVITSPRFADSYRRTG